jgi:4-hydroxybenzoate polyprenyltransferase
MSYSIFRIKEIFPLKNIYTALFMPLGFLVGALSNSEFTLEIAKVFLTIVVLVFVVSLIGDLRDFKGDKSAGIPTVAVVLGYELTKKIALFCLLIFIGWLFYLRYIVFYSILPFVFLALFFLIKNDILKTRILILSSFMFLPIFLVLKNLLEVI